MCWRVSRPNRFWQRAGLDKAVDCALKFSLCPLRLLNLESIMKRPLLLACATSAIISALILAGCTDAPKYKKSSGNFNEWRTYEGTKFEPETAVLSGVDLKANTVTFSKGASAKTFTVTPSTRILHEKVDITLAQIPLNTKVKYSVSQDGSRLLSIWYGRAVNASHQAAHTTRTSYF
jgi:hypothetical protein